MLPTHRPRRREQGLDRAERAEQGARGPRQRRRLGSRRPSRSAGEGRLHRAAAKIDVQAEIEQQNAEEEAAVRADRPGGDRRGAGAGDAPAGRRPPSLAPADPGRGHDRRPRRRPDRAGAAPERVRWSPSLSGHGGARVRGELGGAAARRPRRRRRAGLINTVVGSGTLITFPTLLALGVPPVAGERLQHHRAGAGLVSGALASRRSWRAAVADHAATASRRWSAASSGRCCCSGCRRRPSTRSCRC